MNANIISENSTVGVMVFKGTYLYPQNSLRKKHVPIPNVPRRRKKLRSFIFRMLYPSIIMLRASPVPSISVFGKKCSPINVIMIGTSPIDTILFLRFMLMSCSLFSIYLKESTNKITVLFTYVQYVFLHGKKTLRAGRFLQSGNLSFRLWFYTRGTVPG